MNAGFSSLKALKDQLLAQSLRSRPDFDTQIRALGLGVAGSFATFCNREFNRVVGDTYLTTGGRASLIVPRFPIEAVTALDVRDSIASGWVDSMLTLDAYNDASGVVYFSTPLDYAQIRVTYTGGYWWDTSETNTPDTKPTDAAQIPDAVVTAWHLQCETLWRSKDKLGTKIKDDPETAGGTMAISSIDLTPGVQRMLAGFVRYALT